MNTKTLYGVIIVLLALLVIAASAAGYFYFLYGQEKSTSNSYLAELKAANPNLVSNIVIDYGNGNHSWYNNTRVEPGWNVYTMTLAVTNGNVNATLYGPPLNEHYVTGIGGVENTNTKFWFLWTWNSTASWQVASTGPDLLQVTNRSVFAWTFCSEGPAPNYLPACTPP